MFHHPASLPTEELLTQCDVRRLRRGGPGGQHRNKVETAVVLVHRPTGLTAEANERRSQPENLNQAIFRLRLKLAVAIRGQCDGHSGQPSDLWRERSSTGRIAVNRSHDDFPTLLAEALDQVAAADFDLPPAAQALGTSASQLARFLQQQPAAWSLVNEARRARGLRPLR
jgi:hypothetical protein